MAHRTLRLLRLAVTVSGATLLVVWGIFVLLSDGAQAPDGRLGGDFPAFYAAGKLVLRGQGQDIYNPTVAAEVQRPYLPDDDHDSGDYLMFAYPPFVALGYAPLAALGYRPAYVIHSIWMLACLALFGWLWTSRAQISHKGKLGKHRPLPAADTLKRGRPTFFVATLICFFPLFNAMRGGQNITFVLACAALCLWLQRLNRPFVAGVAAALLLFKPHLALAIALAAFVIQPSAFFIAGFAALAIVQYVMSAFLLGWQWPRIWFEHAQDFRGRDLIQGDHLVSLLEQLQVHGLLALPADSLLPIVTYPLGLGIGALLLARTRNLGFFMPIAVLCMPHLVYYDASLLALAWPGMFETGERAETLRIISALSFIVLGLAVAVTGAIVPITCLLLLAIHAYHRRKRSDA